MQDQKPLYLVTGLSGAGKSTALDAFEDLGFFVVDGLPATLVPEVASLMRNDAMQRYRGMALGLDIREPQLCSALDSAREKLQTADISPQVLFFEANEAELLRRYAFTRRPHPLEGGGLGLAAALKQERQALAPIRTGANTVIDSSDFSIHDMRQAIHHCVYPERNEQHSIRLNILSFGFKYGIPADADYVLDLRFLPNPFLVEKLRPMSGDVPEVAEYIFSFPISMSFCEKTLDFFDFVLPLMEKDCRPRLTIAFGCTGGRHRSVAVANRMAESFRNEGYAVLLEHRNINDDPDRGKGLPG